MTRIQTLFAVLFVSLAAVSPVFSAEPLKLLFLGDNGHHQPAARFKELQPVLKERGIELTYTDKLDDLNAETLGKYAGLVIYANQERISPEQEKALLDYVASGRGLVALHCASFCFLNSDKYVELVGAQFQRHGTGTFRTIVADEEHPILRGFGGFESWDETYVHTKHNDKDRTILEWREERERKEPWTWVRTHGKGRVFYTAWGHDQRTWGNPGFQNLVERGIRWAVGDDPAAVPAFTDRNANYKPQMTAKRTDVKPFEYVEADVPFYPAGERWGTVKNEKRKMQLPLPPEESLKHYVTPVGFEMQLFAAEPDIGKSLAMNWDERGRLWLCETLDYPNELKPRGQGRDRIRICEDTNGDGRADKFTVFAEGLSIPSTLTFYRGGVIVQDGMETLYLKDTTGDDKADLRRTLISGWNMRDTHGGVSNFVYGHDNWYYAMQGYNDSRPVLTDGTPVQSFRQGFFRFKVEGDGEDTAVTKIEFLRSTNNNTWGLGISEEGIIFGSTANGNPSEYMPIPNRYYEAVRGWSASVLEGIAEDNHFEPITENVRQVDHHGGFTAAAGHALYTARKYPKEYWNRTAFVCEPTGHLVATFLITPDGAGFKSRNAFNLVASDDEWAAPIMAEVGPDGNVWILDWYNYIVQHNPTPQGYRTGRGNAYESELRDKRHCRVYRLAYVGQASSLPKDDVPSPAISSAETSSNSAGKMPARRSLAGATPQQLVEALKSDNLFWRRHAQRLLVQYRFPSDPNSNLLDPLPDYLVNLLKLIENQEVDELGLNTSAIHAIWTLKGLGGAKINTEAFNHPSPAVRKNAAAAVEDSVYNGLVANALMLSEGSKSKDPQVRLASLLALSETTVCPATQQAVLDAWCEPINQQDRWLIDALTSAAAKQQDDFLLAISASRDANLQTAISIERITIVANHTARTGLEDPAPLLKELKQAQPPVALAIISGLAAGWPRDEQPKLTPELETLLAELFEKLPVEGKSQLVTLANRWGSEKLAQHIAKIAEGLLAEASAEDKNDEERIAAATQYVAFLASDPAAAGLLDLITPRTSPELARGLVQALGKSQSAEVGEAIAERLSSLTPAVRPVALQVLLSRNDWARPLLDSLEKGNLQLADLSLDQKQALAAHPDRRIAGRARRLLEAGGGLPNADRQKVLEELLPLVTQKGDADAGKVVLKNQCLKCHTHSGEGAKIGPDLTGMAAHPKNELLVHLIDPSRSVEGNFRVYTVLTADGLVINGLLASESKTAIELIDSEAKKHVVQREDIENLKASTKSLMPEGFEKQVKPDDIKNLLEYLTQRGQFVPIPLDKYATITSVRGMFYSEDAQQERLVFDEWGTKTVEGVPFVVVDPEGGKRANAIVLHSRSGPIAQKMPRSVSLTYSGPAKAIHLLSGVAGWAYPYSQDKSTSMIVRLHYENGETEDHKLLNGEHFADYIRRIDVPGSKFAYQLRGQQLRYLSVVPQKAEPLAKIELVKGDDATAPVVMAVTVETAKQ